MMQFWNKRKETLFKSSSFTVKWVKVVVKNKYMLVGLSRFC